MAEVVQLGEDVEGDVGQQLEDGRDQEYGATHNL